MSLASLGVLTGQAVFSRFVAHVFDIVQAAGIERGPVIPEELWEQAISSFKWDAYRG